MERYHINPVTGTTGVCKATKGNCPFGAEEEHFSTKKEALVHYEEIMGNHTLETLSAKELSTEFAIQNVEREFLGSENPLTVTSRIIAQANIVNELREEEQQRLLLANSYELTLTELFEKVSEEEAELARELTLAENYYDNAPSHSASYELAASLERVRKRHTAKNKELAQLSLMRKGLMQEKRQELNSYAEYLEGNNDLGLFTKEEALLHSKVSAQLHTIVTNTAWEDSEEVAHAIHSVRSLLDRLEEDGNIAVTKGEDPTTYWAIAGGFEPIIDGTAEFLDL